MATHPAQTMALGELCIQAARKVIAEHGVEALSMREVALSLKVSHQAPYRHYPSRYHLLAEVMRRCFEEFARFLDARNDIAAANPEAGKPTGLEPSDDLAALGRQYLQFAADHPLEYRLMFGTAWPDPVVHAGLVKDAVHAFNILRKVLQGLHGEADNMRQRVDLDAMFIWASMHGMASIQNAHVMQHLDLPAATRTQAPAHLMQMMAIAMQNAPP